MTTAIKITEARVQNALYKLRESNGHILIVPNCGVCGHEADLFTVSGAKYGYDHEIKLNYADFKADFNKRSKHFYLKNAYDDKRPKPAYSTYCPNYFFYVVPAGMFKRGDSFPRYAGLIEFNFVKSKTGKVTGALYFTVTKQAPRLHAQTLSDAKLSFLARGLMLRYWNMRAKFKQQ